MIFTDDSTKRFEDFKESDFEKSHDNLGIKYGKTEIYDNITVQRPIALISVAAGMIFTITLEACIARTYASYA